MSGCFALDRSVPALIVKVGQYPLHHGGVGVARSLGRLGVAVHAVAEDRFTPVAVSRYARTAFVWPTTGLEDPGTLVDGLLRIADRIGRRSVLVPTDEEAAILVAEHAPALTGAYLFPTCSDPGLPRRLASREHLHDLCRLHGVGSPALVAPRSSGEIERFAGTARYPLVVKAREAYVRKRVPLPRILLVRRPDELRALARRLPDDPGVVLQEYIPREDAEDWIFHGYFAAGPGAGPLFTGVKVRSYPPHFGVTSCGYVVDNPELAALSARFCRRVGFRGIVDLDWRFDRRDGQYKLLDFNPRVGAQFRLFETGQGLDVVRAQHLDLTGRPVPADGQVDGRRILVENLDLRARLRYRPGRGPASSAPPRATATELAWLAADDVKPAVALAVRTGGRAVARPVERANAVRHAVGGRPAMDPVVVIGAGPYGLSAAAHLRGRDVPTRVIGEPLGTWRTNMPRGMILKSNPAASTISAPDAGHTLQDFCDDVGETRLETEHQVVPIETFIRYGSWFQERLVPDVERVRVLAVQPRDGGFEVRLDTGERVRARAVVMATGLPGFAHVPDEFRAALTGEPSPDGPVSHTSQHADLAGFAGRRVVVVGAGQSALESAALLHEVGADVRILARRPAVHFAPPPAGGAHWQPSSPLGRKWSYYAFSHHAALFRHLPERTRLDLAVRVLGPSGAWWLEQRVVGKVPVIAGSRIESLRLDGPGPVLRTATADGTVEVAADHVLLATGYRVDVDRLALLDGTLRTALARCGGSPRLGPGLQSSVPGLYFTGLAGAATFGPVLRFVCGTAFASRRLAAAVSASGRG